MSEYLKPQSPLYHKAEDAYFYPLNTSDQVIVSTGERLNTLFKKTIRENITLQAANWSTTQPYTQTITLSEYIDDYRVDANVVYGSDDDSALNKAAGCLTYIEKNNNEIIFYCLKDKPEIDIPIEITGTCRNTIANITVEEGIKLNFEVVGGTTEPTNPKENTIWVNTDTGITGWYFSATQPENMVEGEVWLLIGDSSDVEFNVLKVNGIQIYPLEAKQMVSGALVDVEEKIYQNEEWKELLVIDYIIQDGNNIVDVHKSGTFREFTPNNNGNLLISTGSGYHHVYFNNIDLTNKDYIILEGEINSTSACQLRVCNNGGYSNVISSVQCTYSGATLDISALSGYYTVELYFTGAYINNIKNLYSRN